MEIISSTFKIVSKPLPWAHTCFGQSLQQPASPLQLPLVPYGSQSALVVPSLDRPAETCLENWGSNCSYFQETVCSASPLMAFVPEVWYHKAGLAPVHASGCWHLYPYRVLGHCNLCWSLQSMLAVWSSFLNKTILRKIKLFLINEANSWILDNSLRNEIVQAVPSWESLAIMQQLLDTGDLEFIR